MERRSITFRLCLMMFLEYSVRGMWYPFLANYLQAPRTLHGLEFTPGETGWVLGFANALGAFTAPIIAGQVADRFFNAEKALATLHFIAAALLFANASSTRFLPFFLLMLCFSIAYVPTQSLTNSLALSHLIDPQHSYPRVRMWGTVGWIVTSALYTYAVLRAGDEASNIARIPLAMRAAAIAAIGYACYAFFALPATPPKDLSRDSLVSMRSLRSLLQPSVLILMMIAVPMATIGTAYYFNIGPYLNAVVGVPLRYVGPTLAIAQIGEVLFLFALGPLLKRMGYKSVLIIGATAQAVRFAVFALNLPGPIVILALPLHGAAFACFSATAILYVEQAFPSQVRHTAQTFYGIAIFGLGPALAGPYSQLFDRFAVGGPGGVTKFAGIWWMQAGIAVASAISIFVFFRPLAAPDPKAILKPSQNPMDI
jgi:nucleoside transporter